MEKSPKQSTAIANQSIYKDGWFLSLCALTFGVVFFSVIFALINIKQTQIPNIVFRLVNMFMR